MSELHFLSACGRVPPQRDTLSHPPTPSPYIPPYLFYYLISDGDCCHRLEKLLCRVVGAGGSTLFFLFAVFVFCRLGNFLLLVQSFFHFTCNCYQPPPPPLHHQVTSCATTLPLSTNKPSTTTDRPAKPLYLLPTPLLFYHHNCVRRRRRLKRPL